MLIDVEIPDQKVKMVIEQGSSPCTWECVEDCQFMQEQLYAILMGWAS